MDEPLVKRVQGGDIEAFKQLIEKYKYKVFSLAFNIVKNHELTEELVQDVFLKVYQKIDTFRNDSKFSTWLFKIVVNHSLSSIRRKKFESVSIDEQIASIHIEEVNAYFFQVEEIERKAMIHNILSQMPAKESALLDLYYLQEFAVKDIQHITGLSMSDVKTSLHRARNRFASLTNLDKTCKEKPYVNQQ